MAGAAQHMAERLLVGSRPGTVTSAPCSTTSYGRASDGPISPSGIAGSSTTSSAPTSRAIGVDPAHHQRVRQQHRLAGPLDLERLGGVELGRAGVRAGEHREPVGRQPPPPLPQQRLDPADLRREVVRDEQVLHRRRSRAEALGGPLGVFARGSDRRAATVAVERTSRSGSRRHHRCCRARSARCAATTRVPVGEVPPPVPVDQHSSSASSTSRTSTQAWAIVRVEGDAVRRPSRTDGGHTSWQSSQP